SPARPRFPTPIDSEPRPMPPDRGLWPDHHERRSNIRKQSAEADQYQPVEGVEAQSLRNCPPQDGDLLPQDQVLSFNRRSRSEQPDQQRPNQSEAVQHRAEASPDSPSLANG